MSRNEELTASQGMADRESTGWRTIDSAPRDGTPILATSIHHGAREVVCWQDGVPSGSQFGDVDYQPEEGWVNDGPLKDRFYANPHWFTHWQPLPAAPMLARSKSPQDDQKPQQNQTPNGGGEP